FHGMADRPVDLAAQPGARLEPEVVAPAAGGGLPSVARQQPEKGLELLAVEAEVGRELPENWSELGAEPQRAGGEEVAERRLGVPELQHVREIPWSLHGEDEVVRRLVMPARKARRHLHG